MRYFLLELHANAENRDWGEGFIEPKSSSSLERRPVVFLSIFISSMSQTKKKEEGGFCLAYSARSRAVLAGRFLTSDAQFCGCIIQRQKTGSGLKSRIEQIALSSKRKKIKGTTRVRVFYPPALWSELDSMGHR